MKEKDLQKFERRLRKLRAEIAKLIGTEDEQSYSREALDEIDLATNIIEKEMGSQMSSNSRKNLQMVDEALKRIDKQEYGKCLSCESPIVIARLEVLPFAQYCVNCQREIEYESN